FGSGKSRVIGSALFAFGLIFGTFYIWATSSYGPLDYLVPIKAIMLETVVYLVAIAIGALAGIGIFLGAIMKA
ncbi:MAG: hypothetical protein QCI38_03985, partial [Candidatus Thermoplasmatota archaeon]|nr:hypothetical protein [Candidatus Thermoplasmatota archaeon]